MDISSVTTPPREPEQGSNSAIEESAEAADANDADTLPLAAPPEAPTNVPPRPPPVSELLGATYVLISTLCFSTLALFVHFLSDKGYPSMQMSVARYFVCCVLSVALILFGRRGRLRHSVTWLGLPAHRRLLVFRGVWGALGMSAYFYALSRLSLADATVLEFVSVPLTAVLGAWLLHEGYSWVDGCTALAAMAGVALIARPSVLISGSSSVDLGAVGISLFGAVAVALAYITIRQLGASVDSMVLTLYFSVVGAAVAVTLLLLFQTPVAVSTWADAGCFIAIGVLGFAAQFLINRGMQFTPAGVGSAMRYMDVVWALIFQVAVLGAPPSPYEVGGCALIGTSIVAILLRQRRKNAAAAAAAEMSRISSNSSSFSVPSLPAASSAENSVDNAVTLCV